MIYAKLKGNGYEYCRDIEVWFPKWNKEVVVIISPHDDDALFGCGITIQALKESGGEVYVLILTDGSMGYTSKNENDFNGKNKIVETRKGETVKAYEKVGVDAEHIIKVEYFDSELEKKVEEREVQRGIIKKLRELKVTRVFLPNEYDFHMDHKAAYEYGLYCGIQATTGIMWSSEEEEVCNIKSFLIYPVWMDFEEGRKIDYGIKAEVDCDNIYLERKLEGIKEYVGEGRSQRQMKNSLDEIVRRGASEYFLNCTINMFDGKKYDKVVFGG